MKGIMVLPYSKRLDTDVTSKYIKEEERYLTGVPIGSNRHALDVMPQSVHFIQESIVITGGDSKTLTFAGHTAKRGDIVRIETSANNIEEWEVAVKAIDGDDVQLAAILSADLAAGDTVSILRPISPRVDSTGAAISSSSGITYILDGSNQVVTRDTVTPSNNAPLPVEIIGFDGSDINITAGDINVQLNHTGATYDSTRIGNGTNLWDINGLGEGIVYDSVTDSRLATTNTTLALQAKLTDTQPVSLATIPLATNAATEAKQDVGNTSLGTIVTNTTTLAGVDYATNGTLSSLNNKFGTLGQKASVGSAPVVLSTEQQAIQNAIKTSVELLDNAVNGSTLNVTLSALGGAATEAKQDTAITALGLVATEATLSTLNSKTPNLGQAAMAGSVPVVLASNQTEIVTNEEGADGGEPQASSSVGATVVTATAPANSIGFMVQADETNAGNIRYTFGSTDPTASLGIKLLPGASSAVIYTNQSCKMIAETGTGLKANIQYLTRS